MPLHLMEKPTRTPQAPIHTPVEQILMLAERGAVEGKHLMATWEAVWT